MLWSREERPGMLLISYNTQDKPPPTHTAKRHLAPDVSGAEVGKR